MNEKTNVATSTSGLQQSTGESSSSKQEKHLEALRKKRVQVKEGHITGGYCDTQALLEVEKEIWKVQSRHLEELKKKHGYSADPKFKHPEIKIVELELNGLAFKPKLSVAE